MIKLTDFLKASNVTLDMDCYKVHLATRGPLEAFFCGEFKDWQEYQTKRNFPCNMVVSLIELRKHKWLFAGVYKILSYEKKSDKYIAYQTELIDGQEDLIGRLIIHHERAGRTSYLKGKQDGGDFEISEILPSRLTIEDFPGHNNVQISHSQLKSIIQQNVQTWYGALSNVKGVYIITDNKNGKQYVGSATGDSGIWQRWSDYAKSGHGGNKELRLLLKENAVDYKDNFQYSILEIADTHATDDQIRLRESYWKSVLCTRDFGYNSN